MNWLRDVPLAYCRLIPHTVVAASIGSLVGSLAYVIDPIAGYSSYSEPLLDRLSVVPLLILLSLFGTVPASSLIGLPVLLPIQRVISAHPWLMAIPTVLLGEGVGYLTLERLFRDPISVAGDYRDIEILIYYAGAVAFGFVISFGYGEAKEHISTA